MSAWLWTAIRQRFRAALSPIDTCARGGVRGGRPQVSVGDSHHVSLPGSNALSGHFPNLVCMLGRQPFDPESPVLVGNDILRQAVEDPVTQTALRPDGKKFQEPKQSATSPIVAQYRRRFRDAGADGLDGAGELPVPERGTGRGSSAAFAASSGGRSPRASTCRADCSARSPPRRAAHAEPHFRKIRMRDSANASTRPIVVLKKPP